MAAADASEPPMVEQVITEFFAKSLHIILESRSPYDSSHNFTRPSPPSSPLSGSQPQNRWFNLALRDCPAALENFDLWRQSNLEPLVIDIVLLRRDSTNTGSDRIIERWVIKYETVKFGNGSGSGSKSGGRKSRSSSTADHSLYRRTYNGSTVLLRSLYLLVRLLPAHNLFQELNSSGRIRPLSLSPNISSFLEPFTCAEDAEMKHYSFSPIETLFGCLSVAVSYVPVLEVQSAPEPSTPVLTGLIMDDYLGSPTTDFLRKLSSLHSDGTAVPCVPVTRRHGWSTEHGTEPSVSSSPCPMNSGRKDRPGGSWLPPSPGRKDKPQCSSQNENLANSPNDSPRVIRDLVKLGEFQNDRSIRKVTTSVIDLLKQFLKLKEHYFYCYEVVLLYD
jgi:autophagy-related protein 13